MLTSRVWANELLFWREVLYNVILPADHGSEEIWVHTLMKIFLNPMIGSESIFWCPHVANNLNLSKVDLETSTTHAYVNIL